MRLIICILALGFSTLANSQSWDTTQPRGAARNIEFDTTEGTWMSIDLSADGKWIVFDLLAHIYRVQAAGGTARCLTQDSGIAENFQPRFSPDGTLIAFISDRAGGENLWTMNADGTNAHPVLLDNSIRVFEPVWMPDGQHVLVRQHRWGEGLYNVDGIWMYSLDGTPPRQLVAPDEVGRLVAGAVPSPDGTELYFDACTEETEQGCAPSVTGARKIYKLNFSRNEIVEVTGGAGGAIAPALSPDGNFLAFARRIPDGTISYRGHRYGPRTALWLRNLRTGAENVVMDPIEDDLADRQLGARAVFHAERTLPGYSWARDGKSIVISQGGQLRRLQLSTGAVETIPFSAHVHRVISEQAYAPVEIAGEQFSARMMRWHTASPDGKTLVFQAVGKIWTQSIPTGTPHRLTSPAFRAMEYSPAWSPDGRWIAFTSWDDRERGNVWRIPSSGGTPRRLNEEPGEYINTAWSPDGRSLLVTKGSGATARGGTLSDNTSYTIATLPSQGGKETTVATVNPPRKYYSGGQTWQATYGPLGRIYFPDSRNVFSGPTRQRVKRVTEFSVSDAAGLRPWTDPFGGVVTELISVRPDGTDRRVHMIFPYATAAAPSPDGQWVAFEEGDNVFLVPFDPRKTSPIKVDRRNPSSSVRQLSTAGGVRPHWRSASRLEFGFATNYSSYDSGTHQTATTQLRLQVPRRNVRGSIALQGARIITLDHRRVIESGTVVVRDGRISCVGECSVSGVDKIIAAGGHTIIPGWVDMHAHTHDTQDGVVQTRGYENAVRLAYGVTTILDPYAYDENVFASAELIETGDVIGPRTFSAGDPVWSGDSPYTNRITSYEDAKHEIARRSAEGMSAVKQYTLPSREQRQWVVDVARNNRLRVTAEGEDNNYDLGMIMDGYTGFEHNAGYAPLYSDITRFFGQAHAVYSGTLIIVGPSFWADDYFRQRSEVWKDPKQRSWMPSANLLLNRYRALRPETDYGFPLVAEGMKDIVAAGGYGALGSHGQQLGIDSHWDVWVIASALGPLGALEVASLHGAHFLGAERDIGSIEVGKLADLMILRSNPLEDIHNTTDIAFVMKAGILYEADSLNEIWPRAQEFGAHPWVNHPLLQDDDRPLDVWDQKSGLH